MNRLSFFKRIGLMFGSIPVIAKSFREKPPLAYKEPEPEIPPFAFGGLTGNMQVSADGGETWDEIHAVTNIEIDDEWNIVPDAVPMSVLNGPITFDGIRNYVSYDRALTQKEIKKLWKLKK